MKKLLDKLLNNIKFDKKYVLFSLIIIMLGIITGSLFIVILNNADKTLVIEYIQSFFESLSSEYYNIDTLKNTIITNYLTILIISIIGFTFVLTSFNILILFYKAFLTGFSISAFILTYKFKGIILSIIYIFPHLILNILLLALLTSFTLKMSFKMIKYIVKKTEVNMRSYFNKYMYLILILVLLITITSLYESFIVPIILKFIFSREINHMLHFL